MNEQLPDKINKVYHITVSIKYNIQASSLGEAEDCAFAMLRHDIQNMRIPPNVNICGEESV